ncbi:MAG: hypothetical protein LBJ43_03990 [Propionibacteriaceae bacterium]|nr:hypothetical protein [Propionibacteriaceae bacterium]
MASLPVGSFNTSKITTVGNYFFSNFNYQGALSSLPIDSFNTRKVTNTGATGYFQNFNTSGQLKGSIPPYKYA